MRQIARPPLPLSRRAENVTSDAMPAVEFERRRHFRAALLGERAARMKAAPGRRVDRARHVALQYDALAFSLRVGHRHRGQQRFRIRVLALPVELAGGSDLDDLAEI